MRQLTQTFLVAALAVLGPVIAANADDRMHGDVHGEFVPIDRSRDRVNEKRHVVVNHLDESERRLIAVFFFGRVVDAEFRLTLPARNTELQVVEP